MEYEIKLEISGLDEQTYNSIIELVKNLKNAKATSQPLLRQTDVSSRFANDKFINNVCVSYRHDFGLMATQDRQRLIFECKEWLRAIENNWQNGC